MRARQNPQSMTAEQLHATRARPNETKMTLKQCDAVVYINRSRERPTARGYVGKSLKHSFFYNFKTVEKMFAYIAEFHNGQRARTEATAARKAERVAFRHTLAVGDVLYSTWGYDQTNLDFYQVTALRGDHQIEAREIESESLSKDGEWTGRAVPKIDAFKKGDAKRYTVKPGNCIRTASYAHACPAEFTIVAGVRVYASKSWTAYA